MTTTEAPSRRPSPTTAWRSGPLGIPAFRRLTIGQFTSTVGDYCYAVALPWLVLSGGGSAASLGIVLACYGIPRALLTLAGGSLADRFGPRLVMIASDGARCGLAAVFAVLAAEHVSSLAAVASAAAASENLWGLLRRSPILQIILVVSVTANFALTGTTEVALPALAHARFGAGGYGAVLTCVAAAIIAGALLVARIGDRFRPAVLIAGAFLVAAAGIAAAPFLGGLPGVAAGMAVFGLAIGFDSVISVTLIRRWAPPAMLGRVWGLLLLASVGSFPFSTFIAGLLTRHLGATPVFPIAGALLALSMLYGLSRREFRDFGDGEAG